MPIKPIFHWGLYILLVVSLAVFAYPQNAMAEDYIVKVLSGGGSDMRFEPKELSVKVGDTVTWVNDEDIYHNVKTLKKDLPEGAEPLKSPGLYKKGDEWTYIFKISGEYNYFCVPHRAMGMVGKITATK